MLLQEHHHSQWRYLPDWGVGRYLLDYTDDRRCREVYRYNPERKSLDEVCKMTLERSSHSICYLDNRIYLIGGFSGADGEVTRECEVLDVQGLQCSRMAPLNTPSANSAATAFGGQFLFKFGGILNKSEDNSLIEMYGLLK